MLFGITMPKSAKSDLNFLDRKNRGEMSMEKNRIRPIKSGKSFRMSYSRQKEVLEMPNLIEIQVDSYKWFLESGLKEVFDDISPITDYSGKLSLEFVDGSSTPKVNAIKAIEKDTMLEPEHIGHTEKKIG